MVPALVITFRSELDIFRSKIDLTSLTWLLNCLKPILRCLFKEFRCLYITNHPCDHLNAENVSIINQYKYYFS